MSSNITSPKQRDSDGITSSPSGLKGKTKAKDDSKEVVHHDGGQDDDEDDEDEDEDEDMPSGDEDEDEEEDQFEEIDPSVIKQRRTRGIKVDYTSKEALKKAGLEDKEDVDDDDDDAMKD